MWGNQSRTGKEAPWIGLGSYAHFSVNLFLPFEQSCKQCDHHPFFHEASLNQRQAYGLPSTTSLCYGPSPEVRPLWGTTWLLFSFLAIAPRKFLLWHFLWKPGDTPCAKKCAHVWGTCKTTDLGLFNLMLLALNIQIKYCWNILPALGTEWPLLQWADLSWDCQVDSQIQIRS